MACGHHKNHQYEAGDWPVRCEFIALKKHGIPALIIFILLIVIYGNSFDCSWHLDDYSNIVKNENVHIASLSWTALEKSLYGIVDSGRWSRPVSYLSFALNYYFSGLDVFGYHLMNMTIHFLSTFILYLFILNTLMLPIFKGRYKGIANSVELLSAVLWMVNPIQVSAVTYVVQRMASMAALFYIMSMYLYLKGRTSDRKWKAVILMMLSVLMGFLSIGTKENAAMLPVSVFLFDLILIQGFTIHNIKKNMMIAVPVFLAAVLTSFLFFKDFNSIIGDYSIRPFTVWERLITEPRVILFYISLLLYPITSRLTLIHEFDISKSFFDPWTTILSIVVILAVLSLALVKARRWPLISYCVIFFFLNHAIEASFISLDIIYEHRNYLPSMLFFVPISLFFIELLKRFEHRLAFRNFFMLALTLLIMLHGITVYIQNNIWKNGLSLWSDNVDKAPGVQHARINLATAYMNDGRFQDALAELSKVLASLASNTSADSDKKARAHGLMGECFYIQGDFDKALMHYRESIKYVPNSHQFYYRIAEIMRQREAFPLAAEDAIKKAIALKNDVANYHLTYSRLLLKKKSTNLAKKEVKIALMLNPDSVDAYKIMAEIMKQERRDLLAEHFARIALMKERQQ
jgi:tetratricopeptide (TPR) repeat protein